MAFLRSHTPASLLTEEICFSLGLTLLAFHLLYSRAHPARGQKEVTPQNLYQDLMTSRVRECNLVCVPMVIRESLCLSYFRVVDSGQDILYIASAISGS